MKSRYRHAIPSETVELTHVGPGSPMGELLRRYWQPVAVSDELVDLPKKIRLLGEDLVVFRDLKGRPGLLELHCSHRGTSLEWGRVEPEGLRCCYHGWLYDTEGRVIDMPCEPAGYAQRRHLEHPAYPVMEFGGLVFAYMGPPEKQPLFPMLDIYDLRGRAGLTLKGMQIWDGDCIGNVRDCNWLQALENVLDPSHLFVLHTMISGAQFKGILDTANSPIIDFEDTPMGSRYLVERNLPTGFKLYRSSEVIIPNITLIANLHEQATAPVEADKPTEVTWEVPVDDTHVNAFSICVWPLVDGEADPNWKPRTRTETAERPGQLRERSYEDRQRRPDDKEAQEGQRPIAIHDLENLVGSDKGISLYRRKLRKCLALISEGKDPLNIIRDPEQNRALETFAHNTVREIDSSRPPIMAPALESAAK